MKISCGTDIIEISRVKESILNTNGKFVEKVYTPNEIEYCENKGNNKYQHYAGKFAAKEAIFKAISNMLETKFSISWKNIEVLNDKNGRPYVNFINCKFSKIKSMDISISHCKEYAVANFVVLYE